MKHHLATVAPWFASAMFLCACAFVGTLRGESPDAGPLSRYVKAPDDSYRWEIRQEGEFGGSEFVELRLYSQTWRGIPWKHQMFILKPAEVESSQALLLIAGGRWRDHLDGPAKDGEMPREAGVLATLATKIKAPVAVLLHVPFQPLFAEGLTEDAAISYTFEQYHKTKDDSWPLLLPMVKSATRAMDAISELSKERWKLDVDTFTVTGGSKRGWTTWLTGAVDKRAVALAPMVIDVLNMGPQMEHQVASFGGFSEQIEDYTRRGLQKLLPTEDGRALREIVDPYSYRANLKQPKLIILGTNDRYWPLDALNLYWDGLEGEKHITYCPNQGHGIGDIMRVAGSIAALHMAATGRAKLPAVKWDLLESPSGLSLTLSSDRPPATVTTWRASSKSRDFRESTWSSQPAETNDKGWEAELARPDDGYSAMFGEAMFNGEGLPYYLTTNVRIISKAAGK